MQGDDDQIGAVRRRQARRRPSSSKRDFEGLQRRPHGLCTTIKDEVKADLLEFTKRKEARQAASARGMRSASATKEEALAISKTPKVKGRPAVGLKVIPDVVSRRRFMLVSAAAMLASPSTVRAAAFNQQDIEGLSVTITTIQSLKQEITASLKRLPSHETDKIKSYVVLELALDAAQEHLNLVYILVKASAVMETPSDRERILTTLYGEMLPRSREILDAKRGAIVTDANAQLSDDLFASYSARAASVLGDRALPLVNELNRRVVALQK
jgi:hypothetical protein